MSNRVKVVVLGCGFGGLGVCHSLRRADADITLLDKHDYHTFQPLLYQVASASLEPEVVGHPIRDLLRDHDNFRFHQTTVTGIDLSQKQVSAEGMATIPYDYLVIALGTQVNYFGVEGASEHAFPLYTLPDAVRLKSHLLQLLEAADKDPKLVETGSLNIVVVGGGPTGVETAGAMAELFSMDFVKDYPNLPVSEGRVILVEGGTSLLGPFKEGLRSYAKEELEKRGVEVRLNDRVTGVASENVTLHSGEQIKSRTVIWAGGLQVNPVAKLLGVELGRGGRVPVKPDLSLEEHPEVFVVGDIAAARGDEPDEILPQLGSVAMQAGRHAGKNVLHGLSGEETTPFHYQDKGFMATIGRGAAVAQMPFGVTLKGTTAWLAWGSIHLALLTGWENRIKATIDWFWDSFQREHASRIDIED